MKKVLFLAIAAVAFVSCFKLDEKPEEQHTYNGYLQMAAVMNQTSVTLDPFNVAFRLNVLMNEGGGDINSAPAGVKNTLFGENTMITFNAAGDYLITCMGSMGQGDIIRTGKMVIKTGNKGMSDAGAQWTFLVDPNETGGVTTYTIGQGTSLISINPGSYIITPSGTNKWTMITSNFIANNSGAASDWACSMAITQDMGDQTVASLGGYVTFSLDIDAEAGGITLNATDLICAKTESPLRYSSLCSHNTVIGNGILATWLSEDVTNTFSTTKWLGESLEYCDTPDIEITYGGYTETY